MLKRFLKWDKITETMAQNATVYKDGEPCEVVPVEKMDKKKGILQRLFWMLMAIAFPGMFLVTLIRPAAADMNLSFIGEMMGSLLTAITDVLPDFETFVDTGFPVLIKIIVYVAVIGVIGLFLYFFRGVIMKILDMIGLTGK